MKKITFALLLLLSSSLFINPSAQAMTLRISTPKIQLELTPGETYSGEIVAENTESEEVKVRLYLEDWVYSPGGTGEKKFSPRGSTPLSASNWITFTPSSAVIAPFGRVTVNYTIKVPKDVKGSYFSVLFFETIIGKTEDEEGVNVLVAGRIGSLFLIEIKGSQRQGQIRAVDIQPPQGNEPMRIISQFENTGNVEVTLGGNFLIMDAAGKVHARGELVKIYTFPGVSEKGVTQWVGRLAAGEYQALLTYDLGKGKTLVEEKPFTVG